MRLINEKRSVSVKELCGAFKLSVVTIRSDLNELGRQGKIVRTHGGALAIERTQTVQPFVARRKLNTLQKRQIGKTAAELVQKAEVIFVDGGTTVAQMREFLSDEDELTVITPSVEIAYWLGIDSKISIYLLGGFFRRESLSTIGVQNSDMLAQWNIAKAFVGAAGLTLEDGLTDLDIGYVEQKRVICQKARTVVGLVDYSKFGIVSLASFVDTDNINIIVTDKDAPHEMVRALEERGIRVVIA